MLPDLVTSVLLALGAVTLLLPLLVALRTSRGRPAPDPGARDRVQALLPARADGDSLGSANGSDRFSATFRIASA